MREIIFTGYAGPVVGVVEVNGKTGHLSAWRCCVLCGWQSTKFLTEDIDAALKASKIMSSEHSEHVKINHPDVIGNVISEAASSTFAVATIGRC